MSQRIVLIESNTSGTGRKFVAAARSLGLEPLLIAEDPTRYPYLLEDRVETVPHATNSLDSLRGFLDSFELREEIVGVYSSSEYYIETAAELARARQLPGPDPAAVRLCRNKWKQRLALVEAGVGVPAFRLALSVQDAVAALNDLPLPVVVKPISGTGSVGVRLCRTRREVELHATALLSAGVNERGIPAPREILLEEYIQWPEYSAEMFCGRLLGITRKHVSSEPYFVETGHDFPTSFADGAGELISDSLSRCLHACGMLWGPVHVEFRCRPGSFSIMEVNPRLAGGFIPELVYASSGVDLILATMALVAGRQLVMTPTSNSHASIRFVCASSPGRIATISGIEEATSAKGILSAQLYKGIGDTIEIHHDFRDRIGHVISRGPTEKEAARAAETALSRIAVGLQFTRQSINDLSQRPAELVAAQRTI